jgi:acylphosphatase
MIREPAPDRRLEVTVRGRVQGVGFRFFVIREAGALGLDGWVANQPDGAVRCVAEGPASALEAFLEAVRQGPNGARVDAVATMWSDARGEFVGFTVRSGWHPGD